MKKRVLSLILAMVLCLGMLPGRAQAAGGVTVTELAEPRYDEVVDSYLDDGFIPVKQGGRWGFLDLTGKEIAAPKYIEYYAPTEGLVPVLRENGEEINTVWGKEKITRWGYIDNTGREVIPCQYRMPTTNYMFRFYDGLAMVKLKLGEGEYSYGDAFIDKTGNVVLEGKYEWDCVFHDGLAMVAGSKDDGYEYWKRGYIDKTGKVAIPRIYDVAEDFKNGVAKVGVNDEHDPFLTLWGLIDTAGREILPCEYAIIDVFENGYAQVTKNHQTGLVDMTGKIVVPLRSDYGLFSPHTPSEGFSRISVFQNGTEILGYRDLATGKEILLPQYWNLTDIHCGYAIADPREKVDIFENRLIDKTGQEVAAFKDYDRFSFMGDHYVSISKLNENGERVYGLADLTTGKVVIPCVYEWLQRFSEGVMAVKYEGKWGYADIAGREVIPCQYSYASEFKEGLAVVQGDSDEIMYESDGVPYYYQKKGLIDISGQEILPFQYEDIKILSGHTVAVKVDSGEKDYRGWTVYKWGIFSIGEHAVAAPEPGPVTETTPVPQKPATYTANPTNDALKVDGVSRVPTAYKIGDANYFQLRDVAMMLNGTPAQFSVDYDADRQAVVIVTGQPYKPLGTELAGAAKDSVEAILGNNDIYINGEKADFAVYKINGANFFQIRALGQALGFNVGWTAQQGMFIESDKPYDPNN